VLAEDDSELLRLNWINTNQERVHHWEETKKEQMRYRAVPWMNEKWEQNSWSKSRCVMDCRSRNLQKP
jgi:hypothetical protein